MSAEQVSQKPGMAVCACEPGTHGEGWQERRSEACLDREREAWRQMLTRYAERHCSSASHGTTGGDES